MQTNIPTLLTLFRIGLIPFFVLFFYLPVIWAPLACTLLFILAALTDWCDGFLARRWQQTTPFGAFLDPVADKVMVAAAMVLVAVHYHTWWITLPSITMIIREIIISALREWMAELGKRRTVAVTWIGKIKTATQMVALVLLLWRPSLLLERCGFIALYGAMLLTFWTMCHYLHAARQTLMTPDT
ncbi:CDP-diacylglycerol--glycerol-3-phosphate 3-phosphatidyltransferase [unidentified bacterial endosymbiont]|uniref:CDP-diacylglycerol--glycerol-3-phosphate 3-phosphatidyltransferase n=1 Tax=unidentified bacterial endosymbiont TaxID=2355 RepID=UPI00209CEC57|nr:CDP-diacylglycerol--glycerol-3-phosphate 3-phosphatidyltransferase [unidentified bacterial endosymbiont]